MTAQLLPLAGPKARPLGGIARGGAWRLVLGASVLALAAAAMSISGAAGLAGPLGSVFGLHAGGADNGEQSSAAHIAPPVVVARAPSMRSGALRAGSGPRHGTRVPRRHVPRPAPPRRTPTPTSPAPVSAPPPAGPPSHPSPGPAGGVEHAVVTVRDTVVPVAPPAQPVLDETVQAVQHVCGLLGGCP
jgi:hypothetical protein